METETATIYGNHGELTVCVHTGAVLHHQFDANQNDDYGAYTDIVRVNMELYRATYPERGSDNLVIDSIHVGFWYNKADGKGNQYAEPVPVN